MIKINFSERDFFELEQMGLKSSQHQKPVSASSTSANGNKNSTVNIVHIYESIQKIAEKQDMHHVHTFSTLMVVTIFVVILIIVTIYLLVKKYDKKRIERLEQNAIARAQQMALNV